MVLGDFAPAHSCSALDADPKHLRAAFGAATSDPERHMLFGRSSVTVTQFFPLCRNPTAGAAAREQKYKRWEGALGNTFVTVLYLTFHFHSLHFNTNIRAVFILRTGI